MWPCSWQPGQAQEDWWLVFPTGLWQSVHIDDLQKSTVMIADVTKLQDVTISQLFEPEEKPERESRGSLWGHSGDSRSGVPGCRCAGGTLQCPQGQATPSSHRIPVPAAARIPTGKAGLRGWGGCRVRPLPCVSLVPGCPGREGGLPGAAHTPGWRQAHPRDREARGGRPRAAPVPSAWPVPLLQWRRDRRPETAWGRRWRSRLLRQGRRQRGARHRKAAGVRSGAGAM